MSGMPNRGVLQYRCHAGGVFAEVHLSCIVGNGFRWVEDGNIVAESAYTSERLKFKITYMYAMLPLCPSTEDLNLAQMPHPIEVLGNKQIVWLLLAGKF